jgi:hypothetical protein
VELITKKPRRIDGHIRRTDSLGCSIWIDDKRVGFLDVDLPFYCYPKVVTTIIVDDYNGLKPIAKALSKHFSMDAFYLNIWD